jgi:hypothetical protein
VGVPARVTHAAPHRRVHARDDGTEAGGAEGDVRGATAEAVPHDERGTARQREARREGEQHGARGEHLRVCTQQQQRQRRHGGGTT